MARGPSPEEAVLLGELVEHMTRSLPKDDRKILEMRLQGYDIAEI